jgi:hypothetical protein
MCPTPNTPSTAALEGTSAAVPPDSRLMARLTTAQRAALKDLAPLCETAVVQSQTDPRAVEVGCSCCPPFDGCGSVPGGQPRGNADAAFSALTRSAGSFTKPGVEELAVTFDGCEPHSGNYGGTVLYRKQKDAWAVTSYTSGLHPQRCQPYRLREGRDVLICEWSDGHQGVASHSVFVYDFAAPGRECWTNLATFVDDSLLCEGEPGKPLTWSRLDRVRVQDLDRDGVLDLRIEGRERSGLPSRRFQDVCFRQLRQERMPTRSELEAQHALLGPLERVVHDFLSDGARFREIESR